MKLKPLAIAVGVALPVAASAGTITATPDRMSDEYLATQLSHQAPAASLALGAQYAVNDIITFTYSHPAKAGTGTTAFSFSPTLSINVTTGGGTNGTLALFESGETTVKYRVQTAPGSVGTDFGTVTTDQPTFRAADVEVSGENVTVSVSSETSQGISFDSTRLPATLIDKTGPQFAYRVRGLDQVIDVESNRVAFNNGTNATTANHTISVQLLSGFTSALGTVAPTLVVTPNTAALTLTGDFAWLDSATTTGIQGTNIAVSGGPTLGTVTGTAITFSLAAATTAQVITLGNAAAANGAIPTQTLAASIAGSYTNNSRTGAISGAATGAYTLNGSSVTVYAVPTSSAVSNFIWMTNSGSSDGEVSIVVNDNGEAIDLGVVGTSRAGREFDVTAALNAGLAAAGETLSGGRVHLDIVTKVPAADIAISAAYRVGDDRVNLLTSIETDND